MTGKAVYVTTDYREKQLQRALLQYRKPENANMVREALRIAGREDLIGNSPDCLVRPAFGQGGDTRYVPDKGKRQSKSRGGKKSGASRGYTAPTEQRTASGKKTKLDRIFGEDSARIRREAARMSDNDGSSRRTKRGSPASPTGQKKGSSARDGGRNSGSSVSAGGRNNGFASGSAAQRKGAPSGKASRPASRTAGKKRK